MLEDGVNCFMITGSSSFKKNSTIERNPTAQTKQFSKS